MNRLKRESNLRSGGGWWAACLVGLAVVGGCQTKHQYAVRVQNNTGADLNEVNVAFENPEWSFHFGFVGNGNNAGYVTDSMPAPPSAVVVGWQDASGNKKSVRVEVNEDGKKNILQNGRMAITVLPDGAVTVK